MVCSEEKKTYSGESCDENEHQQNRHYEAIIQEEEKNPGRPHKHREDSFIDKGWEPVRNKKEFYAKSLVLWHGFAKWIEIK